jgi:hypothetical protein
MLTRRDMLFGASFALLAPVVARAVPFAPVEADGCTFTPHLFGTSSNELGAVNADIIAHMPEHRISWGRIGRKIVFEIPGPSIDCPGALIRVSGAPYIKGDRHE